MTMAVAVGTRPERVVPKIGFTMLPVGRLTGPSSDEAGKETTAEAFG